MALRLAPADVWERYPVGPCDFLELTRMWFIGGLVVSLDQERTMGCTGDGHPDHSCDCGVAVSRSVPNRETMGSNPISRSGSYRQLAKSPASQAGGPGAEPGRSVVGRWMSIIAL